MNNPLSFVAASVLLLSAHLDAHAQFVFPQGDAAWKVDITPLSSDALSNRAYPTHVDVTQVNKAKRIQITWSDGKTTERWAIPGLPVEFYQDPRTGLVRTLQSGGPSQMTADMNFSYDAFAFAWVKPDTLADKDPVSYQGKQCFHYLG